MRGLLSVSFGTSHADTRAKTIDAVEARLREEYPDWAFYSAWTSGRIVAKLKEERGEHHDTLEEAFERMSADGIDDIIVSTMCLMQGYETEKVKQALGAWLAAGGRTSCMADPLLYSAADRRAVARVICEEFAYVPEGDALLLMGHGTEPSAKFGVDSNAVYGQIQDELHALGRTRFYVATVEGKPTFDDVWPLIEQDGAACVHLAPLMIVAGDHAKNDLAGQGPDSWANRVKAHGLPVQVVLKGLGECAGIQKLVCDHVREAFEVREVCLRG